MIKNIYIILKEKTEKNVNQINSRKKRKYSKVKKVSFTSRISRKVDVMDKIFEKYKIVTSETSKYCF
jgi:hypothetical protein